MFGEKYRGVRAANKLQYSYICNAGVLTVEADIKNRDLSHCIKPYACLY